VKADIAAVQEEEMAFCGKCGSQLHENATFCANCGSAVGGAAETPAGGTPAVTQQAYVAPAAPAHFEQSKGFFGSLFDISFTSFVTGKIIKFLYVLAIIALGLGIVAAAVIYSQQMPSQYAIGIVIAAPIVFFLYLILIRMQLEMIIVIFRMSEHLAEIAEQGRRRG